MARESCPLTFECIPWHMHVYVHVHKHTRNTVIMINMIRVSLVHPEKTKMPNCNQNSFECRLEISPSFF